MSMVELDPRIGRQPRTYGGGGGVGTLVALLVALLLLVAAIWIFGGDARSGSDVEQAPQPVTSTG